MAIQSQTSILVPEIIQIEVIHQETAISPHLPVLLLLLVRQVDPEVIPENVRTNEKIHIYYTIDLNFRRREIGI